MLTGRVVDSYTNILTVKLFARAQEEDAYVRDAVDEHTGMFHASLRLNTLFGLTLSTLNAMMVTGTAALALFLWTRGQVDVGIVAMALPLDLADRQHIGLGRLAGDQHLREHRRRAGRHDDDRQADRADRPPGRDRAHGAARRDPRSRTCASAMAARPACSTASR